MDVALLKSKRSKRGAKKPADIPKAALPTSLTPVSLAEVKKVVNLSRARLVPAGIRIVKSDN